MEPVIDIEGKTLAYSLKEIEKLSSEDGCKLDLVTDKVYNLEEPDDLDDLGGNKGFSIDDFDEDVDEHGLSGRVHLSQEAKLDRLRKEYIAVATNANRDPLKKESIVELNKLLSASPPAKGATMNEDAAGGSSLILQGRYGDLPLRDNHEVVHKRFERSKQNLEELIAQRDKHGFEQLPSGLVFKRTIQRGYGPTVDITPDSIVIYNCACWTQSKSEPYDSTWLRRNTCITDLTTDSILPGLNELLLVLRKGEWCEALIKPEAAFGRLGVLPRIPQQAIIHCLIEVVNIIGKDKLSMLSFKRGLTGEEEVDSQQTLTFENFYSASNEARMRGNYFFEHKQYRIALNRYKSGIRILETLIYKDEAEEKRAKGLLLKLYNNTAHAANQLGLPRLALAACKQALLIDDHNPKSYWYKLRAWKLKGHPENAYGVAKRALQLFKDDQEAAKVFRREERELKETIEKSFNEQRELERLMSKALIS